MERLADEQAESHIHSRRLNASTWNFFVFLQDHDSAKKRCGRSISVNRRQELPRYREYRCYAGEMGRAGAALRSKKCARRGIDGDTAIVVRDDAMGRPSSEQRQETSITC